MATVTSAPASGTRGRPGGPSGPTLRLERRLLRSGVARLAALDEVGRGSPAGPACVGVVVVDASVGRPPPGVRDSKQLSPERRRALVPGVTAWATDWAVGTASAGEVDRYGIIAALRLAGCRALARLEVAPDRLLLDGNHDWMTPPGSDDPLATAVGSRWDAVPVVTRVRADRSCTSVAAASILAKVARDGRMAGLAAAHPGYGWDTNMGYGTPDHLDALRRLGPSPHHRHSWRLPGPA